jgi:hypothetical protein
MSESPEELVVYLDALFGRARRSTLIEVRWRVPSGMGRRFVAAPDLDQVRKLIRTHAAETDVFVGVLPRWCPRGGRDAVVADAGVVWVDLDAVDSGEALDVIESPPHLVVESGGPGHLHAYWLLDRPAAPARVEQANRRLAFAVGGDPQCTDAPRILRPPATVNHGRGGAPVRLSSMSAQPPVGLEDLVGGLRDPRAKPAPTGHRARGAGALRDRVLAVAPERYVQVLTGLVVGRDRKVSCPLHQDRTPSLHVYEDPAAGWFCFGCGRGGTVYDLAAELWGIEPRGDGFAVLRAGLQHRLGLV